MIGCYTLVYSAIAIERLGITNFALLSYNLISSCLLFSRNPQQGNNNSSSCYSSQPIVDSRHYKGTLLPCSNFTDGVIHHTPLTMTEEDSEQGEAVKMTKDTIKVTMQPNISVYCGE